MVNPANLKLANGSTVNLIEILKSKIDDEGNGFYGSGNPESSTAYTMYALSIVDPDYDLSKLGAKLASMQLSDGCWGYNGNTQGCVVWGLLEYDESIIKSGTLKNAYDMLMTFMLDDGSFAYKADEDYGNSYSTVQAGLALGVYENGSLFTNIRNQYLGDEDLQPEETEKENEPSVNDSDVPTSVETGDGALIMTSMVVMIVSGGVYLTVKKYI